MQLTIEEKIKHTIQSVNRLIAAGWDRKAAIQNQQNLWHLSNKRMREVESAIPLEN